jgi:hypothetical protein
MYSLVRPDTRFLLAVCIRDIDGDDVELGGKAGKRLLRLALLTSLHHVIAQIQAGEGVQRNPRLCPDNHHQGGAACPFQGCSHRCSGGGHVPWLPRAIVRMHEEDLEDDKKSAILSHSAVRAALVRAAA